MTRSHRMAPTGPTCAAVTVRLGAGNAAVNNMKQQDTGKIVKLAGESQYDLAAVGDEIEAFVSSVEASTQNGWSIGGIQTTGMFWATADGLQGTPGTGTIAVGDYVLAGTITALNTALTAYPKVVKATTQANAKGTPYAKRVLSLGPAGTGAVGTQILIGHVGACLAED